MQAGVSESEYAWRESSGAIATKDRFRAKAV